MYQDKLELTKSTLVYAVFAKVIVFVANSPTVSAQGAEEIGKESSIAEYNNLAIQ